MFEAVLAVAVRTVYAGVEGGIDEGFADRRGTLLLVCEDIRFRGGRGGRGRGRGFTASACPRTSLGALVGGLCAVIEAVCATARLVYEYEKR